VKILRAHTARRADWFLNRRLSRRFKKNLPLCILCASSEVGGESMSKQYQYHHEKEAPIMRFVHLGRTCPSLESRGNSLSCDSFLHPIAGFTPPGLLLSNLRHQMYGASFIIISCFCRPPGWLSFNCPLSKININGTLMILNFEESKGLASTFNLPTRTLPFDSLAN
jgi:hypothetical protein